MQNNIRGTPGLPGKSRPPPLLKRSVAARWLAALLMQISPAVLGASWAGRPLSEVLAELRAAGTPLIYSSQVVNDRMRVGAEPQATQTLERLQEILKPFGLVARPLGANAGYAIVRESQVLKEASAQSTGKAETLDEVTVYASRYSVTHEDESNALSVAHAVLEKTAGTEQDALRALHYFPGTASNSLSALAHVRGGAESETLVQFDGVELYNPVHLKDFQGLFGLLDPELVQSLQFFSGGYPARYGNHNSGVVDIRPRQNEEASHLLGASVLYTRAISSGGFDDNRGSWLAGYRRSSVPAVLRGLNRDIGEPEFEDLVARLSYDWNGNNIAAGMLRLNDDLRLSTPDNAEQASALYHDTYLWASLERDWGGLRNRWLFSHAKLDARRNGAADYAHIGSGALNESRYTRITTLQTDFTAHVSELTAFDFGARVDRGEGSYDFSSQTHFLPPLAATFAVLPNGTRTLAIDPVGNVYSAYVSARNGVGRWSGELGLRFDAYEYADRASRLSPRLNLRYALSADTDVRFSAGRYVQAQSLNKLESKDLMPRFRTPESSQQFILGFDHRFANELSLRVEAYTKHNEHVRPYYENILNTITLAAELKIDRVLVAPRASTSRGLEISLRSAQQTRISWWAAYSWSQSHDRVDGQEVARSWDQPHALNGGFALSDGRWQHSAALTWHSGWPYTPMNISAVNGGETATLAARNSQRFNDFVSLELRTQYSWPLHNSVLEAFFELRNAFNRANDCCREISVAQLPSGNYDIDIQQKSWLSLVPLAGVDWRF